LFRVVVFARSCKMSWMTWENTAESWSTLARLLGFFSLQMSATLNDVNYQDLPRTAMRRKGERCGRIFGMIAPKEKKCQTLLRCQVRRINPYSTSPDGQVPGKDGAACQGRGCASRSHSPPNGSHQLASRLRQLPTLRWDP